MIRMLILILIAIFGFAPTDAVERPIFNAIENNADFIPFAHPATSEYQLHRFLSSTVQFINKEKDVMNNLAKVKNQFNERAFWLKSNFTSVLSARSAFINSFKENNETCKQSITRMIRDMERPSENLYVMQMIDAMGKLESGILHGKFAWVGNYEECVSVKVLNKDRSIDFAGKYCLAAFSMNSIKISQPLTIALCIPSTCEARDVSSMLEEVVPESFPLLSVSCSTPKPAFSAGAIITIFILSALASLCLIASGYEFLGLHLSTELSIRSEGEGLLSEEYAAGDESSGAVIENSFPHKDSSKISIIGRIFLAFSLLSSCEKLFSPVGSTQLSAVHGIRFLSMSWVILGHTLVFAATFTDNIVYAYTQTVPKFWYQSIINGTFSVDSFFLLSGLLVSYLVLLELRRTGGAVNWFWFYFHRFWRLTPTYMLLILFVTNVMSYLMTGPWASATADSLVNQCVKFWWTNLLYINNFYPNFNKECVAWSWYLANDMQFYLLSPIFIYLLYRWERFGVAVTVSVAVGSIIFTSVLSRVDQMQPFGVISALIGKDPQPGYNIYTKPYHRIPVYLVGILTGHLLAKQHSKIRFEGKLLFHLAWCVFIAAACSVVFGCYHYNHKSISMNVNVAALYQGLSRPVWGLSVAWVIYACATSQSEILNSFLSNRVFIVLSRLTYSAYLVHPVVMLVQYGSWTQLYHYTNQTLIYLFLANLVVSYAVAFVLSITVEAPLMKLEKFFLPPYRKAEERK